MNELIIIKILIPAFLLMFAVAGIVENKEAIFDWLYDVGTAVCKWRHRRKKKRTLREQGPVAEDGGNRFGA